MSGETKLKPISRDALKSFRSNSDDIIRRTTIQALQNAEQTAAHGEDAERLISSGMRFTTLALQTAMFLGNTNLLDFQLRWAHERLGHDNVLPEHILARFQIYTQVIADLLPAEHARAVNQYVHWMIARQRELIGTESVTMSQIVDDFPS